jgi:hypothetical protein
MFVDEFFDSGYYQELPLQKRNQLKFGRVCWTHAYYPHEDLQFFRPVPDSTEPIRTIASKFQIESAGADAFHRRLPLEVPRLETNEEFLVVRAKKRPVIVVQPELPISQTINRGYGGRVHRNLCTVAQVFGLADVATRRAEFNPAFIERVRQLEYPHLMFLPERAGLFEVDSLLRLDELQSVFVAHLEPTKFALANEIESLLIDQMQFLLTQKGPNSYTELRQLILGN